MGTMRGTWICLKSLLKLRIYFFSACGQLEFLLRRLAKGLKPERVLLAVV